MILDVSGDDAAWRVEQVAIPALADPRPRGSPDRLKVQVGAVAR